MKLLKTINPNNISDSEISNWLHRSTARAIVLDEENHVGLLYVSSKNYYKLPGGGVEEDESLEEALKRECLEELGTEIFVVDEVGIIVEYREFERVHQTSHCFVAKVISEKMQPNFTEEELSSGFEIEWVKLSEGLRLLNLRQTVDSEGKFIEQRDFTFLSEALKTIKDKKMYELVG